VFLVRDSELYLFPLLPLPPSPSLSFFLFATDIPTTAAAEKVLEFLAVGFKLLSFKSSMARGARILLEHAKKAGYAARYARSYQTTVTKSTTVTEIYHSDSVYNVPLACLVGS
jgi:hypothetical protein